MDDYIEPWCENFDGHKMAHRFCARRAAESYIERQRHTLKDPRVYVESGYRNHEWIVLRADLQALPVLLDAADERDRLARRVQELEAENSQLRDGWHAFLHCTNMPRDQEPEK